MAIDEELISRSNQVNNEADNSESDAFDSDMEEDEDEDIEDGEEGESSSLREEIQKAKNGVSPESTGDIRKDKLAAMRAQKGKELEQKKTAVSAPMNPAKQSLAKVLQAAWENLITSFGLTLLWVDIHYILGYVFGKDLFCDLGEEWMMNKAAGANPASGESADKVVEKAAKGIGCLEQAGCACLNGVGCLIIIFIASIIAMIVSAVSNPIQTGVSVLGDLLCAAVGGCK